MPAIPVQNSSGENVAYQFGNQDDDDEDNYDEYDDHPDYHPNTPRIMNRSQHHVDGDNNNNLIRQYSFGAEHHHSDYKRNSRSAPDLLDLDGGVGASEQQHNYDSLRNAQSTGHGLYDEHNYAQDENIYDEPSDMNYHESDFQQTFSHSDDKFNLKYEEGVGDGTLHGNSRFNTNSDYQTNNTDQRNYDDYEETASLSGRAAIHQNYENEFESLGKDATLPPPVQLTQHFQNPISYDPRGTEVVDKGDRGYDSTLEMPAPPLSPLTPYSYPSPSPPPDKSSGDKTVDGENSYPNMKFYKSQGYNVNDYSTMNQECGDRSFDTATKSTSQKTGPDLITSRGNNTKRGYSLGGHYASSKFMMGERMSGINESNNSIEQRHMPPTLSGGNRRRTTGGLSASRCSRYRPCRRNTTLYSNSSMFSIHQLESLLSGLATNEAESLIRTSSLIQHISYRDGQAKTAFRKLGAISKLVTLLDNPCPEVQRAAMKAIKNIIYTNDAAKMDMRRCGGLESVVRILQTTTDQPLRDLSSAVLWTLSSCDALKQIIIQVALPTLTKLTVRAEPKIFTNVTGCLRNLSSAGSMVRKKLRAHKGFIPVLLETVHSATQDTSRANDKATENAVCILRNLSYRLAAEVPDLKDQLEEVMSTDSDFMDCFGNWKKNKKKQNREHVGFPRFHRVPGQEVDTDSLYDPSVIQSYLQLMMETSNLDTLEGLAGAIQNLTAGKCQFAAVLREAVRSEKGLPVIVDLLRYEHDRISVAAAGALRNLAIDTRNCSMLGEYAMEELVSKLPLPGEAPLIPGPATIYALCGTFLQLVIQDGANALRLREHGGIERLVSISRSVRFPPRCCKAAAAVLHSMWKHRSLRSKYRQDGWSANHFNSKPPKHPLALTEHSRSWLARSIRSLGSSSRRSSVQDLDHVSTGVRTTRCGSRERSMRYNHSGSGFRYSYSNARRMVNGESDRSLAMERNGTTLHEPLNTTLESPLEERREFNYHRSADSWV